MHAAVSRHGVSRGWEASFARKVLKERFRRCLHGSRSGQSRCRAQRRKGKGAIPFWRYGTSWCSRWIFYVLTDKEVLGPASGLAPACEFHGQLTSTCSRGPHKDLAFSGLYGFRDHGFWGLGFIYGWSRTNPYPQSYPIRPKPALPTKSSMRKPKQGIEQIMFSRAMNPKPEVP